MKCPAASGPHVQHVVNVQHVSVTSVNRIKRGRVSCAVSNTHVITGDTTMSTSKGKLSAKATTTLGLATTVAALWFAAATVAGAAVTSAQSTSAAAAPASSTLEVQLQ